MQKLFVSLLAALFLIGCGQDDTPVETTGSVSFIVNGSGLGAGKVAGLTPEKVVVSVEDQDGKVILDNKVFDLTFRDQAYSTEAQQFTKGEYVVTKYLVISASTAAYAAPRVGAEKAGLIDKPLPFGFSVSGSKESLVTPGIIGISAQDQPELFGYNDFGYDLPSSQDFFNVRVKLEMILGGIYYPNIDAPFTVKGFDATDKEVWRDNYNYTGPEENDLRIKDGFHHYSIEVSKWGKTLSQIYTRTSLWERRVREGEVPNTQVFQAEVEPRKVASTVTSWSQVIDGQTVMKPVSKTTYEYNDGRVSLIRSFAWDDKTNKFVDNTESEFIYNGNELERIRTYNTGNNTSYAEDVYTYDNDGFVTHIQHKGEGLTTEVDLVHLYSDRVVKASYRLSNGNGFEYEFVNENGSMRSDKTTRGSTLCSEATYTSDKNINPLKHLGYTDYLMRNYSISNRLTESANYVGCAFPSLVAESYSYAYTEEGYPVRATTHFKGTEATTEVEYTYN